MARQRAFRLFPLALSPQGVSDALGIHRGKIDAAIHAGELAVYQHGAQRRILVCDVVDWIRDLKNTGTWRRWKKEGAVS